ncbi:hypothetical protein [Nocardiopsis protaetiae]|uniref:hypothetical protein n=1 Tax=Nocardiopsis protaetiae TaxID=3382270 RepID=UPI00387AF2B9
MTPKRKKQRNHSAPRTGPQPTDAHEVVLYRAQDGTFPADIYLDSVPATIRARIRNVAIQVAEAPPSRFAGGGMWEAMHGSMTGWFEIRVDGTPRRTHYRMFCLLDYKAEGQEKPLLVLVDGRTKQPRTILSEAEYDSVRALGEDYFSKQPRPIG